VFAQIFDAVIIVSSFTIDIIFLGGVSGEEGQKAAAVLVILLLWRIARVVDGRRALKFSDTAKMLGFCRPATAVGPLCL